VAALAAGYFFWLRDSSLVAVTDVEVAGVESGDRDRIVAELTAAGEEMTTLHVQPELVERAAARFPTIGSVSLDASFPHGLRIEVSERPPTMLVSAGDDLVPVAADGTVLTGVDVTDAERDDLPAIELDEAPTSGALGGESLEQALVAGTAPEPLRPLIHELRYDDEHGVVATLRGDIPVFFGTGSRAPEKWAAASTVLADPKLTALTYLDVRVPERPAVGGGG
jgi:cell division protein FtsQ